VVTLRRLGDKAATVTAAGRRGVAIIMIILHIGVILLLCKSLTCLIDMIYMCQTSIVFDHRVCK